MATPEQWIWALSCGALSFVLMYVFVASPANEKTSAPRAKLLRILTLAFGSFGMGVVQAFSLHAIVHSGLRWIMAASLIGMIAAGIVLRRVVHRRKDAAAPTA